MDTIQPAWKRVGAIGDINFTLYDGGPVFADETGVYPPELEYVQVMPEGDAFVYRVPLEHYKLSPSGKVIPRGYDASWPYPVEEYTKWFDKHLGSVAGACGYTREELVASLLSDNPMARASAHEAMASYLGWDEFDSCPLHLSAVELEERYPD